jgi:membrane associated rhomboid family serine protease
VFPYRDNFASGSKLWSVYVICAIMVAIYATEVVVSPESRLIEESFSFYPIYFSEHPALSSYRLVTASFVHADIFHLAGNILFFVVFGRTLESLFSSLTFLLVFPLLGVAGFLVQWAMMPNVGSPVLGSSGAIAALMGAYLALFPKAKIRFLLIFFILFKRITVPAWFFLPYWITIQMISIISGDNDGVAYGVHAGSFFAGLIAAMIWKVSYYEADDRLSEFKERSFS